MTRRIRILIVDDEDSICFAVSQYLAAFGLESDIARDAGGGAALLSDICYDAVIADLRLGGSSNQDGLRVVSAAHRQTPRPAVVMLTAYGLPELEQKAKACGADLVLQKPLPLRELKDRVLELIAANVRSTGDRLCAAQRSPPAVRPEPGGVGRA